MTCADAFRTDEITEHCVPKLGGTTTNWEDSVCIMHAHTTCTHTQYTYTISKQMLQGSRCFGEANASGKQMLWVKWRGSAPEVGSSSSSTEGFMIISCPTDTRLRSPPLIPRLKKPPALQQSEFQGSTPNAGCHVASQHRTTQQTHRLKKTSSHQQL